MAQPAFPAARDAILCPSYMGISKAATFSLIVFSLYIKEASYL